MPAPGLGPARGAGPAPERAAAPAAAGHVSEPARAATTTVIGCVQADVVLTPVSELPPPGGALLADHLSIRVGGAGANAALALVAAGMPVRLMGCVGDDHLGRWMRDELAPHGLGGELVVMPDEPSGLTVALESPERDRSFLTYLGVNASWGPAMIPDDALSCRNLLLCDYFVTPALQGSAAQQLLETARARGARTFFDTSWDPNGFPPAAREEIHALLPFVDVFLPNEAEACALVVPGADGERNGGRQRPAGHANRDTGEAAAAAGALQSVSGGWVVVKLGARGCLAVGPDGFSQSAPAPAVEVADTTGAGDAFNAGLVRALSDGADWPQALLEATAFASRLISRPAT